MMSVSERGSRVDLTKKRHLGLLLRRTASPPLRTMSTFNPNNILPQDDHFDSDQQQSQYSPPPLPPLPPKAPSRNDTVTRDELDSYQTEGPHAAFGAPARAAPMSADGSISPPSVFDSAEDRREQLTAPTTALGSGSDEPSYDLKPPPPSVSHDNVEALSQRFFSVDHLDLTVSYTHLTLPTIYSV